MNPQAQQRHEMLKIFAGNGGQELAGRIVEHLDIPPGEVLVTRWSNDEVRVQYQENVRGADVFIVQSFAGPVNDRLVELLLMTDAARRASAERVTVVVPYFPYAKQEKKVRGREPISARLVADLMVAAGANRVLTMDLHEDAIQGFFNIPVDHLTALPVIIGHLRTQEQPKELVVVAPDEGAVELAGPIAGALGSDIAVLFKRHPEDDPEAVETVEVIGDLRDKTALIVDDMILGGGTLLNAAEEVRGAGAAETKACVLHPVLSGEAAERVQRSCLTQLIVTDSVPLTPDRTNAKTTVVSVAGLLGEAIERIHQQTSVSELLHW